MILWSLYYKNYTQRLLKFIDPYETLLNVKDNPHSYGYNHYKMLNPSFFNTYCPIFMGY